MNRKEKDNRILNYFIVVLLSICLAIISCIFPKGKTGIYSLIIISMVSFILFFIYINKLNLEKCISVLFFIFLPFMTELNIYVREDYHIVAKEYYRFNYLHLFTLYFLIRIINGLKAIKRGKDIYLLMLFNLICIMSLFGARNAMAGFQDYFRYLNITIVYIFFARIFNFRKYKEKIMVCLSFGLAIQLGLGLLQKIKGGRLGLTIIGEGNDVFRLGVDGYEKGLSGTFGHPGPFGLYCNFLSSEAILILVVLLIQMINKPLFFLYIF